MSDDPSLLGLPLPLTGSTRLFAIVGDPIDQAGSPGLFNRAFRAIGAQAVLVPMQVPPTAVADLLALFRVMPNWDGLVVTVPHKVALAELVDELGPGARRTGAVNAIRKRGGRLVGENFDGIGFMAGLQQAGHDVRGRRVLLVGAGGAGRSLAHALADAGAAELAIIDRDGSRAEELAAAVRLEQPGLAVRAGTADPSRFEVIVNATPPHGDILPVDLAGVSPGALVADIVLKPALTPLLAEARRKGLATHAGIHMLSSQVQVVLGFFGLR